MILSIFNSKYSKIVLFSFLSIMLVLSAEFYFRDQYRSLSLDGTAEYIDAVDPDIILLGNSMLTKNIDKSIFDRELSGLAHRKIRSAFIGHDGIHAAVFYLIIKNKIARSKSSGIPLLIMDHDPTLFASTGIIGAEQDSVKDQLGDHEDVFFNKYFDHMLRYKYYLRSFSTILYHSPQCSRSVVDSFVNFLCRIIRIKHSAREILKGRFNKIDNFKMVKLDRFKKRIPASQDVSYDRSFFPDILQEGKRFKLVFVLSHLNPKSHFGTRPSYLIASSNFKKYVKQHGAQVIDMNQVKELNDPALYVDVMHNNQSGILLNSIYLAKAIFTAGLIK